MNSSELKVGDRIQLHPATGLWMAGARFGTVERLTQAGKVRVMLDCGKAVSLPARDIWEVV